MTMIVAILTKKALVVCADRRRSWPDGSYTDTAEKVFAVGKNVVCAASGMTWVATPEPASKVLLDIRATTTNFLLEECPDRLTVDDIFPALAERLRAPTRSAFGGLSWHKSHKGGLFTVCAYVANEGIFSSVTINAVWEALSSAACLECSSARGHLALVEIIGGDGREAIVNQLTDKGAPIWASLVDDPLLRRVLLSKADPATLRASLTIADGVGFGRRLIAGVSRTKKALGFLDDVSPDSDCYVLTDQGDVEKRP